MVRKHKYRLLNMYKTVNFAAVESCVTISRSDFRLKKVVKCVIFRPIQVSVSRYKILYLVSVSKYIFLESILKVSVSRYFFRRVS